MGHLQEQVADVGVDSPLSTDDDKKSLLELLGICALPKCLTMPKRDEQDV